MTTVGKKKGGFSGAATDLGGGPIIEQAGWSVIPYQEPRISMSLYFAVPS
jgi:hypothetical protein